MLEFLALITLATVVTTQVFAVNTTKTILKLPGGYEKNKGLAWLQKKFPNHWGTIKIGVIATVPVVVGAIFGAEGLIFVSIPFIGISVNAIRNNRRVIRRLMALYQND